jgi:hypothetical protein
MATADNPFVSVPKTDIGEPEDHQHHVPIVDIDDDREILEYDPPADEEESEEDPTESDEEVFRHQHTEAEARLPRPS